MPPEFLRIHKITVLCHCGVNGSKAKFALSQKKFPLPFNISASEGRLAGIIAISFSALAAVLCFIAVPVLIGQLNGLHSRTASNMVLFKVRAIIESRMKPLKCQWQLYLK